MGLLEVNKAGLVLCFVIVRLNVILKNLGRPTFVMNLFSEINIFVLGIVEDCLFIFLT